MIEKEFGGALLWERLDDKKASRIRFNKHLKNDPIQELATDVWLDRCSFPLGMNHKGEFFKLDDR